MAYTEKDIETNFWNLQRSKKALPMLRRLIVGVGIQSISCDAGEEQASKRTAYI